MIAAITGKKCSAVAVIIWKPHFGDQSDFRISQQSLKSAFHMIATIAKCFFSSDHSNRSSYMETSLYFQCCSVVYPFIYLRIDYLV